MKKEIGKGEAEKRIREFFGTKHDKENVKKMKRLAMSHRIKLGEDRKKFCSKCLSMRISVKRIKNNIKTVECEECGNLMRWKIQQNQ
jgi:RNase P subunit RPR2